MTSKILLLLLLFIGGSPREDVKVATYSTGKPETDAYESLSFWVKDHHRAYIQYSHGRDAEGVDLRWLGPDSTNGERGFKAELPDKSVLLLTPRGTQLQVRRPKDAAPRDFAWENENQPDSTGVRCNICAKDEKDAMKMMEEYFLR